MNKAVDAGNKFDRAAKVLPQRDRNCESCGGLAPGIGPNGIQWCDACKPDDEVIEEYERILTEFNRKQ